MTKDWPTYNEALIKRGTILLNLSLLKSWGHELQEMNQGKEGARYRYPDSLIMFQSSIRSLFRLPYRQLQGLTWALAEWEPDLSAPDYSTTCRRVNRLSVHLDSAINPDRPVTITVDSTGIKVGERGEGVR